MISFSSLPNEQSDTQSKMLEELIKNKNLKDKLVAMCADNTNTNFGGAARKGKNNVWRHLQDSLGKEIIGVGCGAHIVHNCIQTAVDCLPFDIECFAVKVYKYFHIYTVRTEELKEFCDFAGVEYSKLLEHGNTRFLSLGPAITRILKIFEGLKSYFLSQDKCPYFLSQLFENPCFKPWLMFATSQISTFEDIVLKIEKDNISATEVAWRINSLKGVMKSREDEGFIPTNVKTLILNLQEEGELGELNVQDFKATVKKFYKNCVDYLDKWELSFGGVHNLQWILLQTVPSWSDIQTSLSNFNARQIKEISEDQDEETKLFDQWQCVKEIVRENISEWNRVDKTKVKTPVEERWKQIFTRLNSEDIAYDAILKVVEFAMCLPGTSAPVERVFSIMKNLWSSEKSRLDVMTVNSMLMVRVNFNYTCDQFYEILLKNNDALRKISSSQKYFWYDKEKESNENEQAGPSNLN